MQEISTDLSTQIQSYVQTVSPTVVATFADSHYMDNLTVYSDSEGWGQAVDKRTPVLWWKMDSHTSIKDYSDNGFAGTIGGTITATTGPIGYGDDGAIACTSGSSVTVDHNDLFSFDGDFTVSTWAKIGTRTVASKIIAGKLNVTEASALNYANVDFFIQETATPGPSSAFIAGLGNGSTLQLISPLSNASTGTWYMLTLTRVNGIGHFYINGVLQGSAAAAAVNQGTGDFNVGVSFQGSVDEVFLLDSALDAEEILCLYNNGISTGSSEFSAFYAPEQVGNGIKEETLPPCEVNGADELARPMVANGGWNAISLDIDHNVTEVGWRSRAKSDANGDFANPESITLRYDARPMNKIGVYTAYTRGRIRSYTLSYYDASGDKVAVGTFTMDRSSSYDIQDLGATVTSTGVQITVNSTWNPVAYARLHELDSLYEEDLSDRIVSLNISKTRENYEDTLPVGTSAANSATIVLNNVDGLFSIDGEFGDFTVPDVKFTTSFSWAGAEDELQQGVFYADSWNFGSDDMTASIDCRDYSKFMQENNNEEGIFFQDVSAGYAVATLAKKSGVPNRKTFYYDKYTNIIKRDRPVALWEMSDTYEIDDISYSWNGDAIVDSWGGLDGYVSGIGVVPGSTGLIAGEPGKTSVQFYGTNDSKVIVNHHSELSLADAWGIEFLIKPTDYPSSFFAVISKASTISGTDVNYGVLLTSLGNIVVAATNSTNTADLKLLVSDEVVPLDEVSHVVAAFDGATQTLSVWVNGVSTTMATGFSQCQTNTNYLAMGGYAFSNIGFQDELEGHLGPVAFYGRALTDEEVSRHYTAAFLDEIHTFPYLYGISESQWEIMTTWSTADLGTFYFDELDNFQYDYRGTLHDTAIERHADVQYSLADNTNIISGDNNRELQVNKVTVEVNPITSINSARQGIWRAPDNESLAVTGMIGTLSRDGTTVAVRTTDRPLWKDSGYFKIDDEIIKYSGKTGNTFLNLERGQLETSPAEHNGGASWTFDEDTDGWAAGDDFDGAHCKIQQQTSVFRTGSGALRARSKVDTDEVLMGPTSPRGWLGEPITAGTSYTASAYVKAATTARSAQVRSVWLKGEGEYLSHSDGSSVTNNTSSWTNITCTATAPANAKTAAVRVQFYDTVTNEVHYIDDVTMPGTISRVREARVYDIKFDQSPAIGVKYPLLTAKDFESTADIDEFTHTPFSAHILVSASLSSRVGKIVILEGQDPITDLNYYFAISGIPLVEKSGDQTVETVSEGNENAIRRFHLKELTIANKFIQDKVEAQRIADFLIAHFKNPVELISLNTLAIPHLQLGDRVRITGFDQLGIVNQDCWVIENTMDYDGGLQQSLLLRTVDA